MQATVQATPKNNETPQETPADENAVITSNFGHRRTSGNVEIVDGMQGVRGSNPLTSTLTSTKRPIPQGWSSPAR
jgi:hypothetical protein